MMFVEFKILGIKFPIMMLKTIMSPIELSIIAIYIKIPQKRPNIFSVTVP